MTEWDGVDGGPNDEPTGELPAVEPAGDLPVVEPSAPPTAPDAWAAPPRSTPRHGRTMLVAALVGALIAGGVGAAITTAVRQGSSSTNGTQAAQRSSPGTATSPGNSSSGSSSGSSPGSSTSRGTADVSAISARVNPAVVDIVSTFSDGGSGAGTGMVLTSSGEVLTNNHVIANATSIRVQIGGTGATHTATVLGYDVADDVALLQIQGVSGLKTVTLADSGK